MRGAFVKYNNGVDDRELPGTVTQLTSLTTAVDVDASQGAITLFAVVTTGAKTKFTVTNDRVRADSIIVATVEAEGASDGFPCSVGIIDVAAGSFKVIVYNPDSGSTAAAPVVHFHVLNPALA